LWLKSSISSFEKKDLESAMIKISKREGRGGL